MSKRIGDIVRVPNTKRKFGASDYYYHARVQYEDGVESHILLTENELYRATVRADKNPEDLIKPSCLRDALD